MIVAPVTARLAFADGRLDARYHCSPGVLANERMVMLAAGGTLLRPVAGTDGLGSVGATSRSKRVYAAPGEESVPYLRPYDVLDYLPQSADLLSVTGSVGLDRLTPEPGTILQTCSGRNLGPLVYADAYLSRFVISDDMLRVTIDDVSERLYALAFLSGATGQALLTRSKTGNVIDHLSASDLSAVPIPFIDRALTACVVAKMREAVETREQARIRLHDLIADMEAALPQVARQAPLADGWTHQAAAFASRLDVAFYDPLASRIRSELLDAGGVRLRDVAEPFMLNRYKRVYVEPAYGRSILSGRQLLQTRPVNLQYIAAGALDAEAYALGENTIAFGARGRAEDRIAQPALIAGDRASWLASHNLMRVRAKDGIDPGWLFLCLATWQIQAQVKASAFGSVVDVVDPNGLGDVVLPTPDPVPGEAAVQCWQDFATATSLEDAAISQIESAILEQTGAAI